MRSRLSNHVARPASFAFTLGRQMMTGVMGMPMASSAAPITTKEQANMLQMRREMIKAMGQIMMKHAERMQG